MPQCYNDKGGKRTVDGNGVGYSLHIQVRNGYHIFHEAVKGKNSCVRQFKKKWNVMRFLYACGLMASKNNDANKDDLNPVINITHLTQNLSIRSAVC